MVNRLVVRLVDRLVGQVVDRLDDLLVRWFVCLLHGLVPLLSSDPEGEDDLR